MKLYRHGRDASDAGASKWFYTMHDAMSALVSTHSSVNMWDKRVIVTRDTETGETTIDYPSQLSFAPQTFNRID